VEIAAEALKKVIHIDPEVVKKGSAVPVRSVSKKRTHCVHQQNAALK
jgi:hypothetical protein